MMILLLFMVVVLRLYIVYQMCSKMYNKICLILILCTLCLMISGHPQYQTGFGGFGGVQGLGFGGRPGGIGDLIYVNREPRFFYLREHMPPTFGSRRPGGVLLSDNDDDD